MKRTLVTLIGLMSSTFVMINCFGRDATNALDMARSKFRDALIYVKPMEATYQLGKPILVSIVITNVGSGDIPLMSTSTHEDYRASLSVSDGTMLQSLGPLKTQPIPPERMTGGSRSIQTIVPGQSFSGILDLRDVVKIEKEGTYFVTVARRIWSWESGNVISDRIRIVVVSDEPPRQ